ncbi:hypothetical protein [uncultured Legionella sp.]|uniref:hypothetical protein n=1 Tax=uncultured Legionella sp. TaxID=210934 RepID=UPI002625DB30|nr:hypothetical protein [uncultured Legionella sp.]
MPKGHVDNDKDNKNIEANQNGAKQLGPDVYENARTLNVQLATKGPAILYALSKTSEHVTQSNILTAVGGMVVGAIGFFGNRFYRSKGDDSAYTYMGQIVGGAQFTAGFLLLTTNAYEAYVGSGDSSPLMNVLKMSGMALALTESTLILINSYLYGEGTTAIKPRGTI